MLIKNKSVSNVDLNYNGMTILPDEIVDIEDSDDELIQLIEMGILGYVWQDGTELTVDETTKALNVTNVTIPDYERFYSREEIQELVVYSEARTDNKIAQLVETDGATLIQIQELLNNDTTVIEELALKSDNNHNHDVNYSNINHTHNAYSLTSHGHSSYSVTTHNHEGVYSPIVHTHPEYSVTTHNHEGVYSKPSHDHGDTYVRLDSPNIVFGTHFKVSKNDNVLTTNDDDDWETHNTLSIVIPESGLYRIGCFYQWNYDDTKSDFRSEILMNNSVLFEHIQEPQDSGGSFGNTGTDQKYSTHWFDYIYFDAQATIHFDLKFKSGNDNKRASIWNSKFEIWRAE